MGEWSMERKGTMHAITGGLILITLGVLIILGKTGIWSFNASWPVLLIAIAVGTLIQNVKDLGGWIILVVGVIFLLTEIFGVQVYALGKYLLPVLLIVVGANILMKQRKR
jgi:predicted membrane protein